MKKNTLLLLSVLIGNSVNAQQIPMFNQYYHSPFVYNPAFTGYTGNTNVFLINHSQWTDMPGSPITRALTIEGSIKEKVAGLGVILYNDITDITNRIGAYGSYSYKIKTGENSSFAMGLGLGVVDSKIDYSKIIVKDGNDLALFGQSQNKTTFDGNAGVLFTWKKLKVGVSVPQLFGNKVTYIDNYSHSVYQMSRHYLASIKYTFPISEEQDINCSPSVLTRIIPGAPVQYDVNALVDWKKIVGLGVTYKSNYAIAANAFVKIHESFIIGYAYEFITNSINTYSGTSHELLLGYTIGISKKKELEKLRLDTEELKKDRIANNERVDSLKKEVEELKKQMQATKQTSEQGVNNTSTNVTAIKESSTNTDTQKNKSDEQQMVESMKSNGATSPLKIGVEGTDGIRIISKKDFLDSNGKEIKAGYYVVVGTYYYNDYALAEIGRFKAKGYPTTSYVFYSPLHYHYVFVDYVTSKETALNILGKVKIMQNDACLLLNVVE